MMNEKHIMLGATLYIPCTRNDLIEIAKGQKLSNIKSLVFCTEDSVATKDLNLALHNLKNALLSIQKNKNYKFIRIRNLQIFEEILNYIKQHNLQEKNCINGFVFPKSNIQNLQQYINSLKNSLGNSAENSFLFMPTLETKEVFNINKMQNLVEFLKNVAWKQQIISLRIGGNDLFSLLNLRRPRKKTIYQTPLGNVIANLATTFLPEGFKLSAPIFEYLDDLETLAQEIQKDLNFGLVGKTAVNPFQVEFIEKFYGVHQEEINAANEILNPQNPGIFRYQDSMCEPATHTQWAKNILKRCEFFGIKTQQ